MNDKNSKDKYSSKSKNHNKEITERASEYLAMLLIKQIEFEKAKKNFIENGKLKQSGNSV